MKFNSFCGLLLFLFLFDLNKIIVGLEPNDNRSGLIGFRTEVSPGSEGGIVKFSSEIIKGGAAGLPSSIPEDLNSLCVPDAEI